MDEIFDVVVIGAGGAGLCAAISIAETGRQVIVLEKTDSIGGHTVNTQGMFPAAETMYQKNAGITDSIEDMVNDIKKQSGGYFQYDRVKYLAQLSSKFTEWLSHNIGVNLSLVTDFKYYGYSTYRIHAPKSRSGIEIINALGNKLNEMDNITLALKHNVKSINHDEGNFIITFENSKEEIKSKTIILATGGFNSNRDMIKKYVSPNNELINLGSSDHTGSAVQWALKFGWDLAHMDSYQAHSSTSASGILITWEAIMKGGFIVNSQGKRFANEITGYSTFAKYILKQSGGFGYEIIDSKIFNELKNLYKDFEEAYNKGEIKEFSNIKDISTYIGCSIENINETLNEINNLFQNKKFDGYGRSFFVKMDFPLYVIKIRPALLHTQGGLDIDIYGRVKQKGIALNNVYAVGDAAAGISGPGADGYLSGNGLLVALILGWISGNYYKTNT